jgi:hypothetical protein
VLISRGKALRVYPFTIAAHGTKNQNGGVGRGMPRTQPTPFALRQREIYPRRRNCRASDSTGPIPSPGSVESTDLILEVAAVVIDTAAAPQKKARKTARACAFVPTR